MAAFLANVGANSSHAARHLESPLHPTGAFNLMPIPETQPWAPPMLRLGDLPHLADHLPAAWTAVAVHNDPDLVSATPTYGDNCGRAARAFSLRQAQPGDLIVFLARLRPATGNAQFALVGRLVIEEVLRDVRSDPGSGWWEANAHVRRARAGAGWDGFWVFRGGAGSGLLPRAVPFDREQADRTFAGTWNWRPGRSELQTIGSYTRTVRRLTGAGESQIRRLVV